MYNGTFQACPIEIGSLGYYSKDVIYVWKDVELDSKMSNMLAQYQLLHVIKTSYNLTDPKDKRLSELLHMRFFFRFVSFMHDLSNEHKRTPRTFNLKFSAKCTMNSTRANNQYYTVILNGTQILQIEPAESSWISRPLSNQL